MEPEKLEGNGINSAMGPQQDVLQNPPKRRSGFNWLQTAWKVFLFLLLTMQVGPLAVFIVATKSFGYQRGEALTPQLLLFLEVFNFAMAAALAVLFAFIEKRPFGDYGLPWKNAFQGNFWLGFLFGLAEASVLVGLIQVFGGYSFGSKLLQPSEILRWGLLHLVLFLFVGLYEEFIFRGYPQFTLSRLMGFWPTAIVLSITFGLVHLTNQGENWVGAVSVILVGLLFAFTLKRSGNLWYAVGLHAGFDWAQSFLYSVPDSGELLRGHLSNAELRGPTWLTGGSVGPEASVFCFLTMGLQFLVVLWLFPVKTNEAQAEPVTAQD